MEQPITYYSNPVVSIIVPNYNHSIFLRQRLDSIFGQTFQNFEVILLDDASTDNSVEILQEYQAHYKNKVSHLILNKENSGSPFPQWKKGIQLARGKYIWIAESDDASETCFLESAVNTLEKSSEIAAYICASKDLQDNFIPQPKPFDEKTGWYKLQAKYFFDRCPVYNASSCVFRSDTIADLTCLQEYKYIADKVFWSKALSDKQVFFEDSFYNLTNTSATSFSRNKRTNPVKDIKVLEEHSRFLKSMYKKTGYSNNLYNAIKKYYTKLYNRRANFKFHPYLYLSVWVRYRLILLRLKV